MYAMYVYSVRCGTECSSTTAFSFCARDRKKEGKKQGTRRTQAQAAGIIERPPAPLSCGVDGCFAERWSRPAELGQ